MSLPSAISRDQEPEISRDGLEKLAAIGVSRKYRKSSILIEEGDISDTIYIVLAGSVKVFASNNQGREIIHDIIGPGEYVGAIGLDGGPQDSSVIAMEPTICSVVHREMLDVFIANNPSFVLELLFNMTRTVRQDRQRLKSLALVDVYGRLIAFFNSRASHTLDGTAFLSKITQADLASYLGCSREMVHRLIKDLQAGGYLEISPSRDEWILLKELPARW